MSELTTLINQANAGDLSSFGELVRRYQDMAVGYAYGILGNRTLAHDAVQEAFIEAHCCLASLREPEAFAGWLRRIVFKQCDRITRRKTPPLVPLDAAFGLPTTEAGPAELLERREFQRQVTAVIEELPEAQRVVISLFYLSGYSQREVAELLELSTSQVNNRLHSARKQLKERMLTMVEETLHDQRPSRDEAFANGVMALIAASQRGEIHKVQDLLADKPSLITGTGPSEYGWGQALHPLHIAAAGGHQDIVEELLKQGADVNMLDDLKRTPLHAAVASGKTDVAGFLIEQGATIDIFAAARLGKEQQVRSLLAADARQIHAKGPNGSSPLHFAADAAMAQLLIDHGADVNARDDHDLTPLVWHGSDMELADTLVQNDADIEDLFMAASFGKEETVNQILQNNPESINQVKQVRGNDLTPLMVAVFNGHVSIVRMLLEKGADANASLFGGKATLLHEAASLGNAEIVRLLVRHGADKTIRDGINNKTPAEWVHAGNEAVVALL